MIKRFAASLLLLTLAGVAHGGATILVVNSDAAGIGFNDTTVATPIGGNTGTTLGEQRTIAFEFAASLWSSVIDSNVTIRVDASFAPLFCNSSSATLGAAGPTTIHANFAGAPFTQTWYPQALANSLTGSDLSGSLDMSAEFNGDLDFNDSCLSGTNWYYGLDNNNPANTIDFLNTVMHELAHGLGMVGFVDFETGEFQSGLADIYSRFSLDTDEGLHWNEMNDSQRADSATNGNGLVWSGSNTAALAFYLLTGGRDGSGFVQLYAPNPLRVGSSVYHWDTSTFPNTLMEPFLPGSVVASESLDLSPAQLKDIGWTIDDLDADLIPDTYDNCPNDTNPDQADSDNNGVGDVCETCSGADSDNDGVPDACDNCVNDINADQVDTDTDGEGDACDLDDDGDEVADAADNCPLTPNPDQLDTDLDGAGDACDGDDDEDSVPDLADNCPLTPNTDQLDTDDDGAGDACDDDDDGDTVLDAADNCPLTPNTAQLDTDDDGSGDACDDDDDADSVLDAADNCPLTANTDQLDTDGDGAGDACDDDDDGDGVADTADNCPLDANADQLDADDDGAGDVCDDDDDGDAVVDISDNCPLTPNQDQLDSDGDGPGNACDNCSSTANADQYDSNGDGYGNACDADLDNNGFVTFPDLALMEAAFFTSPALPNWNPDADFDNNGSINFLDLVLMEGQFFGPPGPSGIAP